MRIGGPCQGTLARFEMLPCRENLKLDLWRLAQARFRLMGNVQPSEVVWVALPTECNSWLCAMLQLPVSQSAGLGYSQRFGGVLGAGDSSAPSDALSPHQDSATVSMSSRQPQRRPQVSCEGPLRMWPAMKDTNKVLG